MSKEVYILSSSVLCGLLSSVLCLTKALADFCSPGAAYGSLGDLSFQPSGYGYAQSVGVFIRLSNPLLSLIKPGLGPSMLTSPESEQAYQEHRRRALVAPTSNFDDQANRAYEESQCRTPELMKDIMEGEVKRVAEESQNIPLPGPMQDMGGVSKRVDEERKGPSFAGFTQGTQGEAKGAGQERQRQLTDPIQGTDPEADAKRAYEDSLAELMYGLEEEAKRAREKSKRREEEDADDASFGESQQSAVSDDLYFDGRSSSFRAEFAICG